MFICLPLFFARPHRIIHFEAIFSKCFGFFLYPPLVCNEVCMVVCFQQTIQSCIIKQYYTPVCKSFIVLAIQTLQTLIKCVFIALKTLIQLPLFTNEGEVEKLKIYNISIKWINYFNI